MCHIGCLSVSQCSVKPTTLGLVYKLNPFCLSCWTLDGKRWYTCNACIRYNSIITNLTRNNWWSCCIPLIDENAIVVDENSYISVLHEIVSGEGFEPYRKRCASWMHTRAIHYIIWERYSPRIHVYIGVYARTRSIYRVCTYRYRERVHIRFSTVEARTSLVSIKRMDRGA